MPCPPLLADSQLGPSTGGNASGGGSPLARSGRSTDNEGDAYDTSDADEDDYGLCGGLEGFGYPLPPPPQPMPMSSGIRAARPDDQPDGKSATDEYDELGFVIPPAGDPLGESARAYESWFAAKARRRRARFETRRRQLRSPGDWSNVPAKTLKALLRKGVPAEHRSEVWWSVLGCDARRQLSPETYQRRLGQELVTKTAEEIERDLPRTFPNNRTFRTEAGRGQLRNVLHAYACHVPRIRYCQGLNFIAALLLLVFLDEERAFWALVCAVETLGVEGYYTEGMKLLRADMRVLFGLMTQRCPKVAKRIQETGVDLTPICSEWYITWFAKCLPIPTIFRVWDALFFEGYKVLFRIAVGVFKRAEPQVMCCEDFEAIMEQAKRWPWGMVQHNELLKASFGGILQLRRRDLMQARERAVGDIEREDEAHKSRILENQRLCAEREEERRKKAEEEKLREGAKVIEQNRVVSVAPAPDLAWPPVPRCTSGSANGWPDVPVTICGSVTNGHGIVAANGFHGPAKSDQCDQSGGSSSSKKTASL